MHRSFTDHFRKTAEKWMDKIINRANEVLVNSDNREMRKTSLYCSTPLSHWFPINMASRFVLTLKHFVKWARTLGALTGQLTDYNPVNNLLLVSMYWAHAAATPINARSAFSLELTENILQIAKIPDLSQSILTTCLDFKTLIEMTEYDTTNTNEFVKSKDFILSKWLQSVMVQSDQSNLKSQLQLIGEAGVGKQTIIFYFDKDHPKLPAVMIPGGGHGFKSRFDLYSPSLLVPIGLSKENANLFHDSILKPHLSTSQTQMASISSGHPFFQLNVNVDHNWPFIVEGLIKNLVQLLKIEDTDSRLKLVECLTNIISNLIANVDLIQMPKLKLIRSCIRFITHYFASKSFILHMGQALELLSCSLLSTTTQIKQQIHQLGDFDSSNKHAVLSFNSMG